MGSRIFVVAESFAIDITSIPHLLHTSGVFCLFLFVLTLWELSLL